ncbi:MAG: hypothetical protein IJA62_00275 [Ruminococcus sp.]|nr:hypothetical protein [Ruminococcus sp.]
MGDSIIEYLERCSVGELQGILHLCQTDPEYDFWEDTVKYVLNKKIKEEKQQDD